ncbi:MAG: nitroreductase [bacterium (Candidatus Stahlbacteria) CG23_combo_of_CG06-09_8_20_14_all_40_9]|nr:MAG: nitroreductase [bacterium (Candidatus Stahlbacteria) CG23_combo_of_CG06-09_8_20_14_all_40_9]
MTTVREAIRERCSVRSYLDKPIKDEKLTLVLDAARLAPSARNNQNWKFIVVRNKKTRERLADAAANQRFIAEAPVVIAAVSTDPSYIMRCGVPAYAVDVAIAVDHMTLQAEELGLGTCWIGAFYQEKVKEILKIPDRYKVVALLPLGYPTHPCGEKHRKTLEEIVSHEKFS